MSKYNKSFSQINQRLPYSKKNKEWRISVVDSLCAEANRQTAENIVLQENYDLYNSQLNPNMFRELCDTLGLNENTGKKYVEKFNILHNIINAFVGEELDRPFSLTVINNNSDVVNQVIREKELKFRKYLQAVKEYTIEKVKKVDELNAKYDKSLNSNKPKLKVILIGFLTRSHIIISHLHLAHFA